MQIFVWEREREREEARFQFDRKLLGGKTLKFDLESPSWHQKERKEWWEAIFSVTMQLLNIEPSKEARQVNYQDHAAPLFALPLKLPD